MKLDVLNDNLATCGSCPSRLAVEIAPGLAASTCRHTGKGIAAHARDGICREGRLTRQPADEPGRPFGETLVCTSGQWCTLCRSPSAGREWRREQFRKFKVPNRILDFPCARLGLPWIGASGSGVSRLPGVRDVIVENHQGPGDAVLITGVIRDLHLAYPGKFRVAVRTRHRHVRPLYEHGPYIVPERELAANDVVRVKVIPRPLVPDSRQHFAQQFRERIGNGLGVSIPLVHAAGSIFLSAEERDRPSPVEERTGYRGDYVVAFLGGKDDFGVKLWPRDYYQRLVDLLGRAGVVVVRLGARGPRHYQPGLTGANLIDLVGQTDNRDVVRIMYRASGGAGPVSFGMHLAAACPSAPGIADPRPYVVLGGGGESPTFYGYPGHVSVNTIGRLDCCASHGCWRKKTNPSMPNPCRYPVDGVAGDQDFSRYVAKCMTMVTPEEVAEALLRQLSASRSPGWAMAGNSVEDAVRRYAGAAAALRAAFCEPCEHFAGAVGPTAVYCRKASRTCGCPAGTGLVNLRVGKCPVELFENGKPVRTKVTA